MAGLQGKVFGEYQLADQIGSGAIAEVYRARPRAGGRDVAVKVVYPEFAQQPSFAPNFAKIQEMAQRLANHPHILPVLAANFQSGYAYLVTPLVQAGSLRDWLRQGGRLDAGDAGPFYRQLCGAVAYAHSLGAIHGNLKPSNIFLYEGRHVLLGDFGLLWDIRMLELASAGSDVQEFAYLAPEVFDHQLTPASDIYSLGAVVFASITGSPPHKAPTLAALREALHRQPPPRLIDAVPTLHPPLPNLDPIIQRAMASRPDQRFASAMQVTQAIDSALRQPPRDVVGLTPGPQFAGMGAPFVPGAPMASPGIPGYPPAQPQPFPPAFAQGMPGRGAGGTALAPASPPFPPLPQSQRADPQMEVGHIVAQAPGMGAPLPPPAPTGPAPDEFLTARIPARSGWGPGSDALALTPTQRVPSPDAGNAGSAPFGLRGLAPVPPLELQPSSGDSRPASSADDVMAMIDWDISPQLHHDAAQRPDRPFSATKLGLPRLTSHLPGLDIPLLPDDSTYVRAAAGYTSSRVPAVTGEDSAYGSAPGDYSVEREAAHSGRRGGHDDSYEQSAVGRASYPPETRERPARGRRGDHGSGGRENRRGYDETGESVYAEAYTSGRHNGRRTRRGHRDDDYDDHDSRDGRREGGRRDPHYDTYEGYAASAEYSAAREHYRDDYPDAGRTSRGGRRSPRRRGGVGRTVAIAAVALLLLVVGVAGTLYMRPTLCSASVCAHVLSLEQKVLPKLGNTSTGNNGLSSASATLKLTAATGSSATANLTIHNPDAGAQTWNASTTLPWLKVAPGSGTLQANGSATLTVTASPGTTAPGTYHGNIILQTGSQNATVAVSITVTSLAKLAYSPASLTFSSCGTTQNVALSNTGTVALTFTAKASDTALTFTPTSGTIAPGAHTNLATTLACSAPTGKSYTVTLASNGGNGTIAVQYP